MRLLAEQFSGHGHRNAAALDYRGASTSLVPRSFKASSLARNSPSEGPVFFRSNRPLVGILGLRPSILNHFFS